MIITDINLLKTKSEPVSSVEEAKEILTKLSEEMGKHETSIGLSAIQIGIPKQVSLIVTKAGMFKLINPVIVERENPFIFFGEGCISFPGEYINTDRYFDVTIDNQVIDGDSFRTERQYFHTDDPQKEVTAIAVQHEIDHLSGIIFHDRENVAVPIKVENKIGRNDPCPCNSGKKYKKCCGK